MTPDPLDFDACPACTDAISVVWHSGTCPNGGERVRLYKRQARRFGNNRALAPADAITDPFRILVKVPTVEQYQPSTPTISDIVARGVAGATPEWAAWVEART